MVDFPSHLIPITADSAAESFEMGLLVGVASGFCRQEHGLFSAGGLVAGRDCWGDEE